MAMTERWPDLAGRIGSGTHVLPVRVYFEDTDFSGAVYHANYLKFCERGRSDCLRLLGVHHHRLGEAGFVVRHMVCDFRKPAGIDDLLEVETKARSFSGARLLLEQAIRREGEVLFLAAVTVAMSDGRGRPCRFPPEIAAAVRSLLGSTA